MRRMPWWCYLWPGLPQIWLYGEWTGLAVALAAAAVLDLALLVSFGWTELIGSGTRNILWPALAAAWIAAAIWSAGRCRRQAVVASPEPEEDSFPQALDHYLKGDNYQAEQILDDLLRRNARDLDARLMLATLLRRAKRFDEATQHLDTLECFEGGEKWQEEIRAERSLLAEAKSETASAA